MLRIEPVIQIHTLRTCASSVSAISLGGYARALCVPSPEIPSNQPLCERVNGALREMFS